MAALHHALGLFEYHLRDFDVLVGGLVEGRGDDLGVDGALHVGNLLGALVDEQNHDVGLGVVLGDGVGDGLEQEGLTGFGRSHDETALTLADGCEHVHDAGRQVVGGGAAGEVELLLGEKGREVLEGHAVAGELGRQTVDTQDGVHGEILLVLARRTDSALHDVAHAQAVGLDLLLGDVYVIGAGQVVVVGRAQEAEALRVDVEDAHGADEVAELVSVEHARVAGVFAFLFLLALAGEGDNLRVGGRLGDVDGGQSLVEARTHCGSVCLGGYLGSHGLLFGLARLALAALGGSGLTLALRAGSEGAAGVLIAEEGVERRVGTLTGLLNRLGGGLCRGYLGGLGLSGSLGGSGLIGRSTGGISIDGSLLAQGGIALR